MRPGAGRMWAGGYGVADTVIDTRTAAITREQGIVRVTIRPALVQSIDDARINFEAAVTATDGHKRPLLVDIRRSEPLTPEARHHYTGPALASCFIALGMLIDTSAFGRMMGNVYLLVARPPVPTRLFTDEDAALAWLGEWQS